MKTAPGMELETVAQVAYTHSTHYTKVVTVAVMWKKDPLTENWQK